MREAERVISDRRPVPCHVVAAPRCIGSGRAAMQIPGSELWSMDTPPTQVLELFFVYLSRRAETLDSFQ